MSEHTILLYSDDADVRDQMRQAIGNRPTVDLDVTFVEAPDYAEVLRHVDAGDVDLLVLDGEATPAGGLGIARQIQDETVDTPPICVVIARAADRWLAAFAKVDATLVHPMDPVLTAETVSALLRSEVTASA